MNTIADITGLRKPEHQATVEHVHRIMADCGAVETCERCNLKISYRSEWLLSIMPAWLRGAADLDHVIIATLVREGGLTAKTSSEFAVHCRELSGLDENKMRKHIKDRFRQVLGKLLCP